MSSTRRTFLKSAGLAALAAGANAPAQEIITDRSQHGGPEAPSQGRVERVNLLQGTDSTPYFSRGGTLPIAALPFGMAHWTLQSSAGTPWMFHPGERRIQGFRSTHQLSPWLSDYGEAVFLPFSDEVSANPGARAASYRVEDAQLAPHSLRLGMTRYRADVELVPTERCCLLQTRFHDVRNRGLLIEVPGDAVALDADAAGRTIRFASKANEGGVPEGFATYYVVRFDESWSSFKTSTDKRFTVGIARFEGNAPLRAAIATSFISFEQAQRNLDLEVGRHSIDELRLRAATTWNEHFSRLTVEGGTPSQQRIFDSCFYRALLFPRTWHEPDAAGKPQHMSPYSGKLTPGVMYADHGYWDVYRAWYPFMTLCFPERLGEILQAWVNASKEGGWLPQFPCPGYRACMTGSLIDAVYGDAAVKGIGGFDLEGAYAGLKKHATTPGDPDKGWGRRGIESYLKLGYDAADQVDQSVAETTDAAYGDFCIAQVAKTLGHAEDAAMFTQRSGNWRHVFDAKTRFFRGKKADGSWLEPFDPVAWGNPYVEGAAWQHRFDVPHDVPALMEAYGGREPFAEALEAMLATAPNFNIGPYGREIHEMSEMAAVPFGQYAHSNQPVHHVLYLFAAAGRPDRTQFWVRRVLNELYSESSFAGDEDTGSMSAWYLLSAIGIYPVCPGKPEYTLGSPLFNRATLQVPGRKPTVLRADGNGADAVYVSGVTIDGKPHRESMVSHAALTGGAEVVFTMSSTPAASRAGA